MHTATAPTRPTTTFVYKYRGEDPGHPDNVALRLAMQTMRPQGVETHLYLTDYRSLYVGNPGEVTADDVLAEDGEAEHVPSYYRRMQADFWLRLWDLRRLVADDTPG